MPSGPASGFFCWRLHWPGNESFHLLWNQCLSGSNHKLQPFGLLILASASQEQAPWAQVKTRWKWHVQQSLAQKKVKKLKKLHDLQQKHVRINPCGRNQHSTTTPLGFPQQLPFLSLPSSPAPGQFWESSKPASAIGVWRGIQGSLAFHVPKMLALGGL